MREPVLQPPAAAVPQRTGYVRWIICGLLFFAATINYIDRQVIGLLKPTLSTEFGWSELDYGDIVFSFQFAYAIGFLIAGGLMDRVGTRIGFAIAIVLWSLAAMGHAEAVAVGPYFAAILGMFGFGYATSVAGFMGMRFLLGLGEAGNFPGAIKTVAEWFPKRERALATGIFNSGTNIGALVTPLIGAVDHPDLRLVLGVRRDWCGRVSVADRLVAALPPARRPSDAWARPSSPTSAPIRSIRRCASPGST